MTMCIKINFICYIDWYYEVSNEDELGYLCSATKKLAAFKFIFEKYSGQEPTCRLCNRFKNPGNKNII